jgi:ribonuclease HI
MTKKISVYGDGSSGGGSAGAIGWGYLITDWEDIIGVGSGGETAGTNNQAELLALINGLRQVVQKNWHQGNVVEIVSDSEYALGVASGQFEPTKNLDLAAEIRSLTILTQARTRWVRGHNGEIFNEYADKLAKAAKEKLMPDKGVRRRHKRRSERRRKRAIVKAYKRGELWRPPLIG